METGFKIEDPAGKRGRHGREPWIPGKEGHGRATKEEDAGSGFPAILPVYSKWRMDTGLSGPANGGAMRVGSFRYHAEVSGEFGRLAKEEETAAGPRDRRHFPFRERDGSIYLRSDTPHD